METITNLAEQLLPDDLRDDTQPPPAVGQTGPASISDDLKLRELSLHLRSLAVFFNVRNQPFDEREAAEVWTRDFANEMRVAREIMLRAARLALDFSSRGEPLDLPGVSALDLTNLAEALCDAATLAEAVAGVGVSFDAFAALGRNVKRELERSSTAARLRQIYSGYGVGDLQLPLRLIIENLRSDKLSTDVRRIFVDLARLTDYLRWIEVGLAADQPLKQTLGVFALLHEEARALQELIDKRALRADDLGAEIYDVLDSTAYAINMELRKVFGFELVGLTALRQAPLIYIKVEQAHGLLSNCFQQSTVALAQQFDPNVEGKQLFDTFQTRLDQSLALCRDLWQLLQFVRRAERERDRHPISSFKSRLRGFRDGSLRYLMYKDWEAYERFVEEISRAHGAVELAPALHRFDCYLETLLGQVRMRAVLADQPLDFLTEEAAP